MKILAINGSPRGTRSTTLQLINAVLDGTKKNGVDIEVVNLVDLDFRFRNACSVCFQEGRCTDDDDFPELYRQIKAADGLVLGSPVYFDLVTGQIKMFVDRMADGIQCQSLSGKYGCSIATSGDHAEQAVVTFMNHFLQMLGATPVGGLGIATARDKNALVTAGTAARMLGRTLVEAIETKRVYPEIEAFHRRFEEKFKTVISGEKIPWPGNYEYWVDHVWVW